MISPFHNEPSQANRISDSLNHRDSSSSQGVAIHDGRVILDLAFKVQCRSSSSVENGVVFHRNCCDFNGVEGCSALTQGEEASLCRLTDSFESGLVAGFWPPSGSAVDDDYWLGQFLDAGNSNRI